MKEKDIIKELGLLVAELLGLHTQLNHLQHDANLLHHDAEQLISKIREEGLDDE